MVRLTGKPNMTKPKTRTLQKLVTAAVRVQETGLKEDF